MPTRPHPRRARRALPALTLALALAAAACGSSGGSVDAGATTTTTTAGDATASTSSGSATTAATTDLVLDPSHDYGDRYADGILPVGDDQYVLDGPETGSIYLCRVDDAVEGGADVRGPWFSDDHTTYDLNQKISVQGDVRWDGSYDATVDGDTRVITTNDVPGDHTTGEFPIASDDPAHQYDANPNTITTQDFTYRLPASPTLLDQPSCMGGESGVMTTGVALFDGFDAGQRDAGAWEVQDGCQGHPQKDGEYHYHTLSSCIDDVSVDAVIGFALDGFPITGPQVAKGNVLTTADLDECHGITSTITLDGQSVTTYHYVMTQDFPYSVSCFRGEPTQPPGRPGG